VRDKSPRIRQILSVPRRADDFLEPTKRKIGERVNYLCSMPACRRLTKMSATEGRVSTLGQACHICAAEPGGPRYDPSQTPEERKSAENGIWLCLMHARAIDNDERAYPVEILREWKETTEAYVQQQALKDGALCPLVFDWKRASRPVTTWPSTLQDGYWIDRPELEQIQTSLLEPSPKVIALLGPPGSGKSSILSRLASVSLESGRRVVAIKAEQLSVDVKTRQDLWRAVQFVGDPVRALADDAGSGLVILDQLDALCDLLDLHTNRLDLLLDLVAECIENGISVVLSSRDFEFSHDSRFRRLDARKVVLSQPSLGAVDAYLESTGRSPSQLPLRLRELCRNLETLRLFDELSRQGVPGEAFSTPQALIERLWSRVVGLPGDPSPAQVALELAVAMGEREELALGLAHYDAKREQVGRLVAAGIMQIVTGERLLFRHQTIFEFCRARAFLVNGESLAEHVRRHQDAVFVRPLLWATLTYLRAADLTAYHRELTQLTGAGFRLHIQVLLAQFIGRVPEPTPVEVEIVTAALGDSTRRGMYTAGTFENVAWFKALPVGVMNTMLRSQWNYASSFLQTAIRSFPERVADLLQEHCVPQKERRSSGLYVLSRAERWVEPLTGVARQLAGFDEVDLNALSLLVWHLKAKDSAAATKILAAYFRSASGRVQNAGLVGDGRKEALVQETLRNWAGFHGLSEVAKEAPEQFVRATFPSYVDLAVLAARSIGGTEYATAHSLDFLPDNHGSREFATALSSGLTAMAAKDPQGFASLVEEYWDTDSSEVHQMFEPGIRQIATVSPEWVVRYLTGDPRRLCLRSLGGRDSVTCRILQALPVDLSQASVQPLEEAILSSRPSPMGGDASQRRRALNSNRRHQLRLLSALSTAGLSRRATRLRDELRTAYAGQLPLSYDEPSFEFTEVASPMSAAQMSLATNLDVLGLFENLPDDSEWKHPGRWMAGGSIQASRELEAFAEANPERALELLEHFKPSRHERPAAHCIEGLRKAGRPLAELQQVVCKLHGSGFRSLEFRSEVALTLARGDAPCDLSPEVHSLLLVWLAEGATGMPEEIKEAADENVGPAILWGSGGVISVPMGVYPILECLTQHFLGKTPPARDDWLTLLEEQCGRNTDPAVWRMVAGQFRWLPRTARASDFLDRLFSKYPSVLKSTVGVRTLALVSWWADSATLRRWIDSLRGCPFGDQAYGELVGLLGTRDRCEPWLAEAIDTIYASAPGSPETVGLAHSLAQLWEGESHRRNVTPHLKRLLPTVDQAAVEALSRAFRSKAALQDSDTMEVASVLVSHPNILLTGTGRGPEFLRELSAIFPELAADLLNAVIKELESASGEFRLGLGGELVDAALSLQRRESTRARGLEMFERLLTLGLYGTREALREIDGLGTSN
jgi:hypothetical protein